MNFNHGSGVHQKDKKPSGQNKPALSAVAGCTWPPSGQNLGPGQENKQFNHRSYCLVGTGGRRREHGRVRREGGWDRRSKGSEHKQTNKQTNKQTLSLCLGLPLPLLLLLSILCSASSSPHSFLPSLPTHLPPSLTPCSSSTSISTI